ncbi:uncharacterized protein LOC127357671 [Dicentrarchus labrax]|uniref:uncharacterized protein LOC127357671 n=1 Tax=Dicentrarchus labrax TaxID=13489 RepID=UPI0021F672E0|nr:uncharacterized protein LOC127357671 [Dicentrarchus labrax]
MERGRQWHCDKRKFKNTEIDSVAVCLICKQRVGRRRRRHSRPNCPESRSIFCLLHRTDSAQLLVFLRGVNEDFEVCQELAGLETLKGTTKGTDVFMAVQRVMDRNSLKWENLSGITTDGAPAMVGKRAGLTALVSDKVREFVKHSLKYFYTASSGVPNFPEFVSVGLVDEVQMFHYDSNTRRAEPKQDWMIRATADDPQYWERETDVCMGHQRRHKDSIEYLKQRFEGTGVHILQWVYGCDWDDETDDSDGYAQYGFDGEDFIAFDLKTVAWIAPKQQAFRTKHKWDRDKAWIYKTKHPDLH